MPGKYIKRIGKTFYEIEVGRKITKRRAIQLTPRYNEGASGKIFEVFGLQKIQR